MTRQDALAIALVAAGLVLAPVGLGLLTSLGAGLLLAGALLYLTGILAGLNTGPE